MKDGPKGWGFDFRLKVVKLGIDADGDAVTTCVIEELDESESLDAVSDEAGKPARSPPVESLVMHAMRTKGDGEWTAAQLAEALGEDTTRASVKSALARLREKGFLAWREGGLSSTCRPRFREAGAGRLANEKPSAVMLSAHGSRRAMRWTTGSFGGSKTNALVEGKCPAG